MRSSVVLVFLCVALCGCGADFQARKAYFAALERAHDACAPEVGPEPASVPNFGVLFGAVGGFAGGLVQADEHQHDPDYQAWQNRMDTCVAPKMTADN